MGRGMRSPASCLRVPRVLRNAGRAVLGHSSAMQQGCVAYEDVAVDHFFRRAGPVGGRSISDVDHRDHMARLQQPDPPVHLSAGGVPAICCVWRRAETGVFLLRIVGLQPVADLPALRRAIIMLLDGQHAVV